MFDGGILAMEWRRSGWFEAPKGFRTGCRSIQAFVFEKSGQEVRDHGVVEIGERKVRIAAYTRFGQMHDGDITPRRLTASAQSRAIARRTRHWSWLGTAMGSAGMLSP
jgi:hypothetical protein